MAGGLWPSNQLEWDALAESLPVTCDAWERNRYVSLQRFGNEEPPLSPEEQEELGWLG